MQTHTKIPPHIGSDAPLHINQPSSISLCPRSCLKPPKFAVAIAALTMFVASEVMSQDLLFEEGFETGLPTGNVAILTDNPALISVVSIADDEAAQNNEKDGDNTVLRIQSSLEEDEWKPAFNIIIPDVNTGSLRISFDYRQPLDHGNRLRVTLYDQTPPTSGQYGRFELRDEGFSVGTNPQIREAGSLTSGPTGKWHHVVIHIPAEIPGEAASISIDGVEFDGLKIFSDGDPAEINCIQFSAAGHNENFYFLDNVRIEQID